MSRLKNRQFHMGMTLLEVILTTALVSVFFTVVAAVMPAMLEQYIIMKKTAEAVEIAGVIEKGLASEMAYASEITPMCVVTDPIYGVRFEPSKTGEEFEEYAVMIRYVKDGYYHYYPADYEEYETWYDDNRDIKPSWHTYTNRCKITENPNVKGTIGTIEIGCKGTPTVYNSILDYRFYGDFKAEVILKLDELNLNDKKMFVDIMIYESEEAREARDPIYQTKDFPIVIYN